jgi:hypothetical protein
MLAATASQVWSQAHVRPDEPHWRAFFAAAGPDGRHAEAALAEIAARWQVGFSSMIVDLARFLPSPRQPQGPDGSPSSGFEPVDDERGAAQLQKGSDFPAATPQPRGADIRRRLTSFLAKQTGQRFGDDLRTWRRWMWSLPASPHSEYADFKAELYGRIDPSFRRFFRSGTRASIRLDEIDWGGVTVNGIPPLRMPRHIPGGDATWLRDSHIVFGVEVNGEARAYPKRILAWHEMANDRLGGVDLTVVYCTLCGTVIPYESRAGGRRFTFGTSGLLYRSNKLMFDEETSSLWSAIDGTPVVGPLVGTGLHLPFHSVVTTTWGEWKRDYPATTVLSIDTGFERNYAEGVAYREYFGTDRLMFEVPVTDSRLKNKAEVVVLRPGAIGPGSAPVALAVDRLRREPVLNFEAGGRALVVVTSRGGANRVFERGANEFSVAGSGDSAREVRDRTGGRWTVTPQALVSDSGDRLAALPTHRAFWFGWIAQHPDTVLIRFR